MPLGLHDSPRARYTMYRPPSLAERVYLSLRDYVGLGVTLLVLYWAGGAILDHTGLTIGKHLRAIPMPRPVFDAVMKQETAWEFHYLLPGEEQLVLRHLTADGTQRVRATWDRFTDGHPPANADLPPSSLAPLYRVVLADGDEFFDGSEKWAMRTMRYRRPADWPYRPLFFFQAPGPEANQRYVLAFGGGTEGTLEPHEERALAAIHALRQTIQHQAPSRRRPTRVNAPLIDAQTPR